MLAAERKAGLDNKVLHPEVSTNQGLTWQEAQYLNPSSYSSRADHQTLLPVIPQVQPNPNPDGHDETKERL